MTPELKAAQSHNPSEGYCSVCLNHGHQINGSLMHVLNGCPSTRQIFKWRHNLIEDVIVEEIRKTFRNSSIGRSITLLSACQDLSDATRNLKPDITAIAGNQMFIVEINCPYASMQQSDSETDQPTPKLTIRHQQKTSKYQPLIDELRQKLDLNITFAAVVVSSLGSVVPETMKDLCKIFKDKHSRSIAKRISYQAILGSAVIFHRTRPRAFGDPRTCPYIKDTTELNVASPSETPQQQPERPNNQRDQHQSQEIPNNIHQPSNAQSTPMIMNETPELLPIDRNEREEETPREIINQSGTDTHITEPQQIITRSPSDGGLVKIAQGTAAGSGELMRKIRKDA